MKICLMFRNISYQTALHHPWLFCSMKFDFSVSWWIVSVSQKSLWRHSGEKLIAKNVCHYFFPSINSDLIRDLVHSSVCGSYHQGCIERFGISAGTQFSSYALCLFFHSAFKSYLNSLDSTDLNIILLNGDLLYKEQDKSYFLSVPNLLQKFKFGKVDCLVEFQFNCFGFIVSSWFLQQSWWEYWRCILCCRLLVEDT